MGRHVIERFAAEIVKQDIEEGPQLRIEGTPSFLVDGKVYKGQLPESMLAPYECSGALDGPEDTTFALPCFDSNRLYNFYGQLACGAAPTQPSGSYTQSCINCQWSSKYLMPNWIWGVGSRERAAAL